MNKSINIRNNKPIYKCIHIYLILFICMYIYIYILIYGSCSFAPHGGFSPTSHSSGPYHLRPAFVWIDFLRPGSVCEDVSLVDFISFPNAFQTISVCLWNHSSFGFSLGQCLLPDLILFRPVFAFCHFMFSL